MPLSALLRRLLDKLRPNRRYYDRRPVAFAVRLQVAEERMEAMLLDVSPSGGLLRGIATLPIGTLLALEIAQIGLRADARVVRHTPDGVGIAFSRDGVGAIIAGWASGQTPSA